jgi:hypothetical protein
MVALRIVLVCLRVAMLISLGYLAITDRGEASGFAALLGFLILLLWSTLTFEFTHSREAAAGQLPDNAASDSVEPQGAHGRSPWSAATVSAANAPTAIQSANGDRNVELQMALGDKYQVRELIGQGGFGEVYAVRDLALNRDLAAMFMLSGASSTSFL